MIEGAFIPPNYRCSAVDRAGHRLEWLTFSKSVDALRDRLERLEELGYTELDWDEYDFADWEARATKERKKVQDAIDKGEVPKFTPGIWSDLKDHLFELFNGKCAYCEAGVLHVAYGDVEHYRPKKGVREDAGHGGYYWLAYEPKNLLPCCEKCNRARGKATHFPVRGFRAQVREEIDREEPLLINPYSCKPGNHLKFVTAHDGEFVIGMVKGVDDIGESSEKIYNLNRAELVRKRRQEQEKIIRDLGYYIINDREKFRQIWKDMRSGRCQYSAAVLQQAEDWLRQLKRDCEEEQS